MSEHDPKRRRRRTNRYSLQAIQWVALGAGLVLALMGGGLLLWAHVDRNPTPRFFGFIYLAAGGVSFLIGGLVAAGRQFVAWRKANARPDSSSDRTGLALLSALLLVAFLSGVVIQSLTLAHLRGRAAEERRARFLLRTAALDAAWQTLGRLPPDLSRKLAGETTAIRLPSGITTRVTVQPADRAALPPPLRRPDLPLFGQYLAVTARAAWDKRESVSRGLACRVPSGELRILSWIERP